MNWEHELSGLNVDQTAIRLNIILLGLIEKYVLIGVFNFYLFL